MKKISTSKPRVPIGTFNRLVDDYSLRHGTGAAVPGNHNLPPVWPEIKIKNDSGANRPLGGVLKIASSPLTDKKNAARWFTGQTPTDRLAPFAVLLEPIPYQKIGRALRAGVCMARVNVQNILHRYVDTTTSGDNLITGPTGYGRLLVAPTQTGVQDCWIDLGDSYRGTLIGKPNAGISANGSGQINIWDQVTHLATGYSVTAYTVVALTAAKWVTVEDVEGSYHAFKWEC